MLDLSACYCHIRPKPGCFFVVKLCFFTELKHCFQYNGTHIQHSLVSALEFWCPVVYFHVVYLEFCSHRDTYKYLLQTGMWTDWPIVVFFDLRCFPPFVERNLGRSVRQGGSGTHLGQNPAGLGATALPARCVCCILSSRLWCIIVASSYGWSVLGGREAQSCNGRMGLCTEQGNSGRRLCPPQQILILLVSQRFSYPLLLKFVP